MLTTPIIPRYLRTFHIPLDSPFYQLDFPLFPRPLPVSFLKIPLISLSSHAAVMDVLICDRASPCLGGRH